MNVKDLQRQAAKDYKIKPLSLLFKCLFYSFQIVKKIYDCRIMKYLH